MRAVFKNEEYFRAYIGERQSILLSNKDTILDDEMNNKWLKVQNCLYKEQILIAKYSLGASLKEIQSLYSDTIDSIFENWNSEIVKFKMGQKVFDSLYVYHHDSMLRLISIGVLFDATEELTKLRDKLSELNITNRLFDKLINYIIPSHNITSDSDSHCPTAFNKFEKLVFSDSLDDKKLVRFQNSWYPTLNKNYFVWKDTHLNRGKGYFGYWSFSVAAIAKINSLSSEKLLSNIFFPTDMLLRSNSIYVYQMSNELKLLKRIDELISKMGGIRRSTNDILSLRKDILKMKKPKFENIEISVNSYIQWLKDRYTHEVPLVDLMPYFERIEFVMIELNNSR